MVHQLGRVGGDIWATYAAMLGCIGGEAFEDDHTKAFLLAFGLAIGTNIVIEIIRHFRKKRRDEPSTLGEAS